MSARRILILIAMAVLAAVPSLQAQDQDAAAAQAAMLAAATPGPIHAFLAEKTGSWDVTVTMWTQPGAEPGVSTVASKIEMVLDGRYMREDFSGEFFGMPFTGIGFTGYNNSTGLVTATWIDNMSTGTMIMTGKYDKAGDPLETSGKMFDPVSGKEMTMRSVTTWKSNDEFHIDYYVVMEGMGEYKSMSMAYKR
ncbi:MAG: DUF1579 domain-containing protein [Candidatus Latescibacteria bacterium]|nr:DUF1579 domain-containing protein [Candidatus Latescibacterota bacterium]